MCVYTYVLFLIYNNIEQKERVVFRFSAPLLSFLSSSKPMFRNAEKEKKKPEQTKVESRDGGRPARQPVGQVERKREREREEEFFFFPPRLVVGFA